MSKELEALEAWKEVKDAMLEWTEGYEENFDIIEKALKALEIIKRNPFMVGVDYCKCIDELKFNYQEYLKYFPNEEDRAIKNEEEYDLLKEVLKDG